MFSISFLILSLIIVYLRLTLLLLFSYPICLFRVIFKQSLKILTRVCYGRRNKGYLEELHLGDGRAFSRKVDSGM
ncbi:unnamed protein product, partial [Vitis vinifera]